VGEYVPMAEFRVGIGGPPDAARSPVVDYPGMPSAELVTAHVELLLEEAGVRDMSQENVELAARWYEPWATTSKAELLADLPRAMELCHPEVEWSQREEGRTLRGREGVREALEGWLDSFDEYRFEVWRIFDCGFDEVLVVGLEVGRGAISGAEVRSHTYELLTFRDGKIVRFRDFHDEREAIEDLEHAQATKTAREVGFTPPDQGSIVETERYGPRGRARLFRLKPPAPAVRS
jgi:ketosteroid isomerase-like protein